MLYGSENFANVYLQDSLQHIPICRMIIVETAENEGVIYKPMAQACQNSSLAVLPPLTDSKQEGTLCMD